MGTRRVNQNDEVLKLDFDRRDSAVSRLVVTSDAGLLLYRELDNALGLSTMAGETLADARTARNGRHALVGLLRPSVFGRLAGYEDVNDAERLRSGDALDCRWQSGAGPCGFAEPDGSLRNAVARGTCELLFSDPKVVASFVSKYNFWNDIDVVPVIDVGEVVPINAASLGWARTASKS
jgi:hypothetical protein